MDGSERIDSRFVKKRILDMKNDLSLDDLYHMVAFIYGERNAERPATATFSHFVEACGMLTLHDRSKPRGTMTVPDALCKALAWYFPLMAKFNVSSVEDLIYRKFPFSCPYCRSLPHKESICKNIEGAKTVDHAALSAEYQRNQSRRPVTLDQWQSMFSEIYPRNLFENTRSTLGLFEELGELAEAIRVFDRYPKYFAGEAADVFSYLMGVANEYTLKSKQQGAASFSLESEFLRRYPGLCVQCGYQVCVCPLIPDATVGRLAKELDLAPADTLFRMEPKEAADRARDVSERVLERLGGYSVVAQQFPLDRGETNKALVVLCLKVAESVAAKQPLLAETLRAAATLAASSTSRPGSRHHAESVNDVVKSLESVWPLIRLALPSGSGLPAAVGRLLQVQGCRFGVVTALPKEFAAMRSMFEEDYEHSVAGDPNDYVIGTIPAKDLSGNHLIALTLLKGTGNNSAAAAATNLFRSFPGIRDVLMVGVAGGVPNPTRVDRHVRLGDIVIADKQGIFQYDNLKIGLDSIKLYSSSSAPSAAMIGKVNVLESDRLRGIRPWEEHLVRGAHLESSARPSTKYDILKDWAGTELQIDHPQDPNRQEGRPKILYGKIGASNTLLKNPTIRDLLREQDVLAVEMEGSGIADSTWIAGVNYIVVRGICDYCDPSKGDEWQGYAAIAAAAYARALIETFPVAPN